MNRIDMTAGEAHRRQQERAQVRAIVRRWAAEVGLHCPASGQIPADVVAAWEAAALTRMEFGIEVDGKEPTDDDTFADFDDARGALGDPARERLMVRTVTAWQEVPR